jgi:glucose-6-phosphate-specific signal transduction histidine kinase
MSVVPTIRASDLFVALIAGLVFVGSFNFNQYFDGYFVYAPGISLLFIPAGVKLLAFLVGRTPAVVGLVIASIYTGFRLWTDVQTPAIYYFALVSVLSYPIAASTVMYFLGVQRNLDNLRYWHIAALSMACSVFNGIAHNIVYVWQGLTVTEELWTKSSAMAFGDFFGCLVVVGIFHTLMLITKQFSKTLLFKRSSKRSSSANS